MNTILSFMDKLYSDSKTLSLVYVVGAVLLFIFIVMLIISLRKPKDEPKIIEEPKIDDESKADTIIETKNIETDGNNNIEIKESEPTPLTEQSVFEKTVIIPLDELQNKKEEKTLEEILDKSEEQQIETKPEIIEENISTEIPNVDDFVDNIVKKTYEKNEQFSSVYVGDNTSTTKLNKIMEDLNVDEKVVETIVPEEEKTITIEEPKIVAEEETVPVEEHIENNSLDNLKKALEEKKKEVSLKQDDLKSKLESLKQNKE